MYFDSTVFNFLNTVVFVSVESKFLDCSFCVFCFYCIQFLNTAVFVSVEFKVLDCSFCVFKYFSFMYCSFTFKLLVAYLYSNICYRNDFAFDSG